MWELIGTQQLIDEIEIQSNLVETFSSGPFPLFQGQEERISMSELHSYDELAGLNSDDRRAPALFEVKRIVQVIYESDYRFAQPPKMPTLTASPDDGRVILTWDDVADQLTREPLLQNVNDFEGYKLFRATDKRFSDAEVITDGFGTPLLKKPIFQCDLKDGISGFTDFGLINGASFNLGSETGIVHHFIDENVENGRTYYYALVAYDYGAPDIGPGIAPSENQITLVVDQETDQILSVGPNVAIVTPRPASSGYRPPTVGDVNMDNVLGEGSIEPEILAANSLKPDHTYKIRFGIDTLDAVADVKNAVRYTVNSMRVYDASENDKLVYQEIPESFAFDNITIVEEPILGTQDTIRYSTLKIDENISTDVFDGIRLNINLPVEFAEYDWDNSQWTRRMNNQTNITISPASSENLFMPWDYDIIFTENDSAFVAQTTSTRRIRDEKDQLVDRNALLIEQAFSFYVENKSFIDSSGSYEKMELLVHDLNLNGTYDPLEDRILVGATTESGSYGTTVFAFSFQNLADSSALPQPGDTYSVTHRRPFWQTDSVLFKVNAALGIDEAKISSSMKEIRVVPNPYVATNTMEPATSTIKFKITVNKNFYCKWCIGRCYKCRKSN